MERLTKRKGRCTFLSDDACNLCGFAEKRSSTFCENIGCASSKDRTCPYLQIIDRLAAYEDTGLEPQEIAAMAKGKLLTAEDNTEQKLQAALVAAVPAIVQAIVENMPTLVEAYITARAADPNKEG